MSRLTLDDARKLKFKDLIEHAWKLLEPYEAPSMETLEELEARISKTLDELPDVYAWLVQLQSFFDHWTDAMAETHGMKSGEYKQMRERRDAMDRASHAAKLRYEGTSRRLTQLMGAADNAKMPNRRG